MIPRRLITSLVLFLTGCAGAQQGYPSLARRAIETAPTAEAAPLLAPDAPDPALDAYVARLTAQADAGSRAFDKVYATADRAANAASGAAISSDSWVAAQQAITALESARNDSVSALASLDVLYAERSNAIAEGKATGSTDSIDAARTTALTIVDGQNDRIDALKERLRQP